MVIFLQCPTMYIEEILQGVNLIINNTYNVRKEYCNNI